MAEDMIWQGRSSQLVNYKAFTVCLILWLLLIPAMIWIFWANFEFKTNFYITLVWLFIPAVFAFKKWLDIRFHVYELSSQRLRITTGIFSKRTDDMELYRVKDITLVQPFFMRLFGLGNVVLDTSDRTTPVVTLHAVRESKALIDEIREAVEVMRQEKHVREVDFGDGDVGGVDGGDG